MEYRPSTSSNDRNGGAGAGTLSAGNRRWAHFTRWDIDMAKAKQKSPASPVESILGITPDKASELYLGLTDRERQVADLMATGMKNRKLAEQLGISTKTLDIHRTNVKRKLYGKTSVDVVRVIYAKKLGEYLK